MVAGHGSTDAEEVTIASVGITSVTEDFGSGITVAVSADTAFKAASVSESTTVGLEELTGT